MSTYDDNGKLVTSTCIDGQLSKKDIRDARLYKLHQSHFQLLLIITVILAYTVGWGWLILSTSVLAGSWFRGYSWIHRSWQSDDSREVYTYHGSPIFADQIDFDDAGQPIWNKRLRSAIGYQRNGKGFSTRSSREIGFMYLAAIATAFILFVINS